MPTPKFTPGAQLFPISLTAPAFNGLNLEQQGAILTKEWATSLDNAVFDDAGRPAARLGWTSQTSSAVAGTIKRIFEYFKADGSSEVIFSTNADIFKTLSSPSSIEGSISISNGNIKFVNFNDKVIAFGVGSANVPAVYTGTNFASVSVSAGTAPTSTIGTAAFGRLWGVDTDKKTVRYSKLLDETDWSAGGGGGSIDFSNVWPAGQDEVVAIEEFGGDLVVFGTNNTVIMTDGAGSSLGIDPTELYVSDTIPGTGAISQFAIARGFGDLWVLTNNGVVGLKRELVHKSTQHTNVSRHQQSQVITWINAETSVDDITLEYSPRHSFVVVNFPTSNKQLIYDTRWPLEQGAFRATTWTSDLQTIKYERNGDRLLGSLTGVAGEVMQYVNHSDNGTAFIFDYESGWLDLGEQLNIFLKFTKRLTSFVFVQSNTAVTHKVDYDFGKGEFSLNKTIAGSNTAEWGNFEWGSNGVYDTNDVSAVAGTDVATWAGSVSINTMDAPLGGSGQYIKVGISVNTSSGSFALQQVNLFAKVGRIAT